MPIIIVTRTIIIAASCLIKPLNINIDYASSKRPSNNIDNPVTLAKKSLSTFEFSYIQLKAPQTKLP